MVTDTRDRLSRLTNIVMAAPAIRVRMASVPTAKVTMGKVLTERARMGVAAGGMVLAGRRLALVRVVLRLVADPAPARFALGRAMALLAAVNWPALVLRIVDPRDLDLA